MKLQIACQEQIPFKLQSFCRDGLDISGSQGLDICQRIPGSTGAHNVEGKETRSNEDATETLNIAKAEADRTCLSA